MGDKEKKEGSSQFCPDKVTDSLADAKCAGSPCKASDADTCCAEKCSAKKDDNMDNGFMDAGPVQKQQKKCKASHKVVASGKCARKCAASDEDVCCKEGNNTTAQGTTDANGVGLVSSVAMLVILSAS